MDWSFHKHDVGVMGIKRLAQFLDRDEISGCSQFDILFLVTLYCSIKAERLGHCFEGDKYGP